VRRGLDLPLSAPSEVGCPDGPFVVLDIVRGDTDVARFATKVALPIFIGQGEAVIDFAIVGDVGCLR